jgi:FAD/FMN-containing dehydrogenase
VITPEDPGYDDARTVYFKGIDRRPAAIARPTDADGVAAVVNFARESGAELAVRSGGHSRAGFGTSEGGIVLDLAEMNAVDVDVEGRTAWAETGVKAADYTNATGAHGLATGLGDAGTVGVGGITLGGGVGFLVRKNGLTIDDLLAADVVNADGELVRADEDNHPDLFWALRGGGGNFGVATRFRFRLHEIDRVVGGMMMLPATAEVIASLVAAAEAAPEELSIIANVMAAAPPMPMIPAEQHGKPVVMVLMVFAGPEEEAESAIAPLRALDPIADMVKPMRYPEIYEGAEGPTIVRAASNNLLIDGVDADAAAAILDGLGRGTAAMNVCQIRVLGGAMARVPAEATAFGHRDAGIMANVAAAYEDEAETDEHEAWVDQMSNALANGGGGSYVGFLGDEGLERAYPPETLKRLAEVKRQYDPDNLFRLNLNVAPAAG